MTSTGQTYIKTIPIPHSLDELKYIFHAKFRQPIKLREIFEHKKKKYNNQNRLKNGE